MVMSVIFNVVIPLKNLNGHTEANGGSITSEVYPIINSDTIYGYTDSWLI